MSTCCGPSSAVQRSPIAASSSASSPRSALLVTRESSSDVSVIASALVFQNAWAVSEVGSEVVV